MPKVFATLQVWKITAKGKMFTLIGYLILIISMYKVEIQLLGKHLNKKQDWEDMGRFGKARDDLGRLGKFCEDLGRHGK